MPDIFPAWVQVHPSFVEPDILLQYNQVSGAFDLLAGENPRTKISSVDQYVYIKRLSLRTRTETGQATGNSLPSAGIAATQIKTPTYFTRSRAEYDHHDIAAGGQWGVGVPAAMRMANRQGIFQQARNLLLYGRLPSNGEGLLNTNGATYVTLPPDTNGNDTILTYDNGQMSFFLLSLISSIKTRMYQLGMPSRVAVCGPQEVLAQWTYAGIVQVTQFQRTGAGTATTAEVVKTILAGNGDTIDWTYDDTLKGKGAGGTDAIIFTIPEIVKPTGSGLNTGEFNKVEPGLDACVLQYMDMAAPREIPTPLAGGATDVVFEQKFTSGWAPRPEAVTVLSAQYM
jgi:hypothetical protein